MLKELFPPKKTLKQAETPALAGKTAPSVRTPITPPPKHHNDESATRRSHRQRMKDYFTEPKPGG